MYRTSYRTGPWPAGGGYFAGKSRARVNRYRGLDQLFLGHAPVTIAERHYTATSKSALDGALAFLRKMYKVDKITTSGCEQPA